MGRAALTAHFGWKGGRSGVRLESRTGEPVRSPKITSVSQIEDDGKKKYRAEFENEEL